MLLTVFLTVTNILGAFFSVHRPATRSAAPQGKTKTSLAKGRVFNRQHSGAMRLGSGSEQIGRQPMQASAKSKGCGIVRSNLFGIVEGLMPWAAEKRLKSLRGVSAFAL